MGVFTLILIRTFDQLANLFTKELNGSQLRAISFKLGLVNDSAKQGGNETLIDSQTLDHSRSITLS